MKKILPFCTALFLLTQLSPAAVSEGDVAIIRVNGNTDGFTVLALKNLSASDSLFFTDAAWQSGGGFDSGEGAGTTDILTANILAGSTFDVATSGLNASGEQVFLFTGTKAAPSLVYGINWNNSGWITSGATLLPLPTSQTRERVRLRRVSIT